MGTLKINWWIASITAILLLFGAFVVVNAVEKQTQQIKKVGVPTDIQISVTHWFDYNGPDSSSPDYEDAIINPQNYSPATGTPSCNGDEELCAVNAEDDNGRPSESDLLRLQSQILKQTSPDPEQVLFLE